MCRDGSACDIGDEVGRRTRRGHSVDRALNVSRPCLGRANEVANSARRVLLSSREMLVSQIPSTSTCMLTLDTNRYNTFRYYSQRRSIVQAWECAAYMSIRYGTKVEFRHPSHKKHTVTTLVCLE